MQHILKVNMGDNTENEGLVVEFYIFFDFKNNNYFL